MNFKSVTMAAALAVTPFVMPSIAAAEDFNATVISGHPPVFRWVRMIPEAFIPAAQAALEGTGHSLTFSEQYGGAIAGVGEELEAMEAGLAELGACQSLFEPAKLAPQNVTYYTPFVSDSIEQVGDLMSQMNGTDPSMQQALAENGVTFIGATIVIDDYLLMTNFPVNSLADLEGRKIAAPGAAGNWLSGTGAVPVSGNLTTYYNELKTGVYDGVLVFASAALPGKLYEVAPNILRAGLGAQSAGFLCANTDWYESLPEEVKTALKAGGDAAQAWYTADLQSYIEQAYTAMEEAGATVTTASEEMRQAWAAGMDNAAQEWADTLDGQGKNGNEILSSYMQGMRDAGATPVRDWDQE